jgi:DNA-binding HxlR family transcriptional regulator
MVYYTIGVCWRMPITKPEETKRYQPWRGEIRILEALRAAGEVGLRYSQLGASMPFSGTALANFLRRLQYKHLIEKSKRRHMPYHITNIGLTFLTSLNPTQISSDDFRARRKKEIAHLWRQVHNFHRSVYEKYLRYNPGARALLDASVAHDGLVYIGALKTQDGKEFLSVKTPSLEELRMLGWMGERERKEALARFRDGPE